MRIHTDKLTQRNVYYAVNFIEDVWIHKADQHGSKTHNLAFEVQLRGMGDRHTRKPNYGTARNVDRFNTYDKAATHDDWGDFLAALYEVDPSILCGSKSYPIYRSRAHFHVETNGRYNPNSPNYYGGPK